MLTSPQKQWTHNKIEAVRIFLNQLVFLNRLRTTQLGAVATKLALKQPKAALRFLRTASSVARTSANRLHVRQMGVTAINLALYAFLAVIYFLVALQWLNGEMAHLFRENLEHYAIAALLLTIGQGILLGLVTSGLLRLGNWATSRKKRRRS